MFIMQFSNHDDVLFVEFIPECAEITNLNIVERIALHKCQNEPSGVHCRYNARNMMTDER